MPEHGFSLTRIFLYNERIYKSILYTGKCRSEKTAVWQIIRSVLLYYFTNIWSALRREMTEHKYILTFLTPK